MPTYVVPDNPADPELAGYEMMIMLPRVVLADHGAKLDPIIEIMQEYAALLSVQDALAGMAWADVRQVVAAITFDLLQRDDGVEFLRMRSRNALAGSDNMPWIDKARVARALSIAAQIADG